MACRKAEVLIAEYVSRGRIREIGSTGAPLPQAGFAWLAEQLGPQVRINSLSGGTDVCTAFVGGVPWLPICAGEISAAALGCSVAAWDHNGKAVIGEVGEMVITQPMPSMPVFLWGDPDGERYQASYFSRWPGVWRHGDWVQFNPDGSLVISGRSDATLNRGGVRLGTAEFYRVVEELSGVADSLVVHLEDNTGGPGELLLFVVPSSQRDPKGLIQEIKQVLREQLSPRHVPDRIKMVPAVPRTLSGKKLEIPVKKILLGANPDQVADSGALIDPESLAIFVGFRRETR
jgi:acetoacetyl-CoA synthetase